MKHIQKILPELGLSLYLVQYTHAGHKIGWLPVESEFPLELPLLSPSDLLRSTGKAATLAVSSLLLVALVAKAAFALELFVLDFLMFIGSVILLPKSALRMLSILNLRLALLASLFVVPLAAALNIAVCRKYDESGLGLLFSDSGELGPDVHCIFGGDADRNQGAEFEGDVVPDL